MRKARKATETAPESTPETAQETTLRAVPTPETVEHPLIVAARRELEEAGKLDTMLGQQALRLAEKLCSPFDTGSAAASASKELRAVMAEALADVTKQADSLDELAERRLKRASGG